MHSNLLRLLFTNYILENKLENPQILCQSSKRLFRISSILTNLRLILPNINIGSLCRSLICLSRFGKLICLMSLPRPLGYGIKLSKMIQRCMKNSIPSVTKELLRRPGVKKNHLWKSLLTFWAPATQNIGFVLTMILNCIINTDLTTLNTLEKSKE
jgi:hypothetical protein